MNFVNDIRSANDEWALLNLDAICWVEPIVMIDARGNSTPSSRVWFIGGTRADFFIAPAKLWSRMRGEI